MEHPTIMRHGLYHVADGISVFQTSIKHWININGTIM